MSAAPNLPALHQTDLSDLDPTTTRVHADTDAYNTTTSSNGNPSNASNVQNQMQNAKDSFINSAQSAMAAVNNHPTTQNIKDQINNGPVGQNVKAEATATKNEFADLANARRTPDQRAATGQPLTHYHSMFYRLLSWKNPRATAISFAVSVIFIFSARYLNILRLMLKALYMVLGVSAAAEVTGRMAFGKGLMSQMRPKQYVAVRKASLERFLDDVEQFINFFVIEAQRVVFAENLVVTGAAFFAAVISYWLIKLVPFWGLSLIATIVAYMGPLVYIKNKDVIDAQLERGYHMATQQAHQIRDIAAQQTSQATKTIQTYAGEYTHKAQETINQYTGRASSPEVTKRSTDAKKGPDFPAVPKEPVAFPSAPKRDPNVVVGEPNATGDALGSEKVPIVEPSL